MTAILDVVVCKHAMGLGLIPSFTNKVTTKDAKSAKEDEEDPLQIFASFALFAVTFFAVI